MIGSPRNMAYCFAAAYKERKNGEPIRRCFRSPSLWFAGETLRTNGEPSEPMAIRCVCASLRQSCATSILTQTNAGETVQVPPAPVLQGGIRGELAHTQNRRGKRRTFVRHLSACASPRPFGSHVETPCRGLAEMSALKNRNVSTRMVEAQHIATIETARPATCCCLATPEPHQGASVPPANSGKATAASLLPSVRPIDAFLQPTGRRVLPGLTT